MLLSNSVTNEFPGCNPRGETSHVHRGAVKRPVPEFETPASARIFRKGRTPQRQPRGCEKRVCRSCHMGNAVGERGACAWAKGQPFKKLFSIQIVF